jgi:hypothetical protein
MKKTLLLVAVLCSVSGVANAWGWNRYPNRNPTPVRAPEINPASAGAALTLLLGGLTVLRSRVGKKK